MVRRTDLRSSYLFILSLIFLFSHSIFCQTAEKQEITVIEPAKPLERKIDSGQKHLYQITLTEKQFVQITVEQKGIDIAVSLLDADKKAFAQKDLILKSEGQEKIGFAALKSGIYFVEIGAKPNTAAGNYILLAEKRDSTEKERSLEEARKLHNESIGFYNKGDYDEALKQETSSLEIREKLLDADDTDIAISLGHLGVIQLQKGNYNQAVSLLKRALKIEEKAVGTYHQDVARFSHNLALTYDKMNDYPEAILLYEKVVDIREKVLGKDNPDLATTLNNLGVVYSSLADFEKAEQFVRRALEIKERVLEPNHPSIAASLSTLAGIISEKGDEDKALELYKRALEIRKISLAPNHPDIARSLEYVGSSYVTKGDLKQAETNYLQGLEILQKRFGETHYRIARMLGSMAVLYQLEGDYRKAEKLFQETVSMMEKTVGKEDSDYATAIYNLAWFYTDEGNYAQAETLYQQALSIAENLFGSQHPDVIIYLRGLARNYQAKGETTQALNLWSRAHLLSERNAQAILFTSSEKQKLLYLNTLSGETNQYLSAHLKFAPNDQKALELALTTIFERKGRVSDAMAFEFASLRSRFDKNDQILLDNLKQVTSQLAQKILSGIQDTTAEAHEKEIKELEEKKENLEQQISRKSSEFRSKIQPVTISKIQSTIPENASLIEFGTYQPFDPKAIGNDEKKAFGEPHYVVYILHNQGEIRWVDLGTATEINIAINEFRGALRDPKRKDFQQIARILDQKIMQPIRPLLGNSTQLLISPDGNLNLIPFEALVNEKNRFLIENYSVTYLTSGRDLLRLQTTRTSKNNPLLIANPSFGEPDSMQLTAASRNNKRQSLTATRNLTDTYFAPLGGTIQEAKAIQTLFPEATFLSGKEATEMALEQVVAPRILHIATHGFFLEDGEKNRNAKIENPLLRSGLALAGANQSKGIKEDGILTALEASSLNLWGTKLVVLSACDTGLGEVKNGEGIYGLRRAFVLAGTESLVMSLWSVSDYVTRELMTNYYKNLKQGMGRGEALRQVQLQMLKNPNRQHPFYWASFIQSGEWANLEGKR